MYNDVLTLLLPEQFESKLLVSLSYTDFFFNVCKLHRLNTIVSVFKDCLQ